MIPLILIQSVLCQCEPWLAIYVYYNGKGAIASLEKTANIYQWQLTYPTGKSDRRRFKINEVKGIEICRTQVFRNLVKSKSRIKLQELNINPQLSESGLSRLKDEQD